MRDSLRERLGRVRELVAKEFRQILRDPKLRRVTYLAPVAQLIVFGYAVSTDIRDTATFVVDHDHSPASRELVGRLTASNYFRVVDRSDRPADMIRALDRGEAIVAIQIPRGFAKDLSAGRAEVQALFDGTHSNTAKIALGYAERIALNYGVQVAAPAIQPAIELRERAWFNPDLNSRNYNVPAVVGAILLQLCLILTALAIVREKEIGTLEQLRVTPLTPGEMIAGKTIPMAVIGLVDLAVVTTIACAWFGVPFQGSLVLLFAAGVLFLMSGLGMGLLISTGAATQQQAMMVAFLIFMPFLLLSGFMFPVSSMPTVFQWLTVINPVRHFVTVVRAIFLKGAGLEALWPSYLALLALGVTTLMMATRRFRRVYG